MSAVRPWLVVAAALLWAGLPGTSARGSSLPPCAHGDQPTFFTAYDQWERTLVDTSLRVTPDYVPPDLRPVSDAGVAGIGSVRALVVADLAAMGADAEAAGAAFAVQSGYRSYAHQEAVFNGWVARGGLDAALLGSARAGHSEHQLGLALDFRSPDGPLGWQIPDWATTPPGAWLAEHAWEYGFQMSYPRAFSPSETCYQYEPWHYRYVGRGHARIIHDRQISLRAYLWQFGNDLSQHPTPTPAPTPSPTPEPSPKPTLTVAPTARPTEPGPTPVVRSPPSPGSAPIDSLVAVSVGLVVVVSAGFAVARSRRRPPAA